MSLTYYKKIADSDIPTDTIDASFAALSVATEVIPSSQRIERLISIYHVS